MRCFTFIHVIVSKLTLKSISIFTCVHVRVTGKQPLRSSDLNKYNPVHNFLFSLDRSAEWNKLKQSDREKLGIVFEDDGEFWYFCS
jgi:hypothetical protein